MMNLVFILSFVTLFARIKCIKSGANQLNRQGSVVQPYSKHLMHSLTYHYKAKPMKNTIDTSKTNSRYQIANPNKSNIMSNSQSSKEDSSATDPVNTTVSIQAQSTTETITTTTQATTILDSTIDPNSDSDDQVSSSNLPGITELPTDHERSTHAPKVSSGGDKQANDSKPNEAGSKNVPKTGVGGTYQPYIDSLRAPMSLFIEKVVLFYIIFIVYISVVKIVYSNILLVRDHITEKGILMIAGIVWELILRNTNVEIDHRPRFSSRIFFYLYLPSTVFDSGALLANKWLLLNLLPIISYSLFGVVLYSAALGLTIYSLNHNDVFSFSVVAKLTSANFWHDPSSGTAIQHHLQGDVIDAVQNTSFPISEGFASATSPTTILSSPPMEQLNSLTMVECLLISIALSTVDSTGMLNVLKRLQLNERLYYLVLGENLMNNAVAIILTILILDFIGIVRVTVVKIYMTILQVFAILAGSILLGISLAVLALIFVRLVKRLQPPKNGLSESQAIIETLLLLKLAYLTYALAAAAGMSSIISLAVFSMLNLQYIKQNLNLRSQLAIRQMVLAAKTLAFTLIYPLLGMLLIEVAYGSHLFYSPSQHGMSAPVAPQVVPASNHSALLMASPVSMSKGSLVLNESTGGRYLQSTEKIYWNFKFVSIVFVLTLLYRLIMVVVLSLLCNLLTSRRLRIKLGEQFLIAYGGFTSPLAMSIIIGLSENEEYRDTAIKNRHVFMYTVLTITFLSTTIMSLLTRPLVVQMHKSLSKSGWRAKPKGTGTMEFENRLGTTKVFDEINNRAFDQLAQAISGIIGRHKSAYDRIADFNELHATPWLTHSGSNINSLSVFYDNLVLEETLNSNSFPAHDLYNLRTVQERPRLSANAWRNRRRLINVLDSPLKPSLDTINEDADWSVRNLDIRSSDGSQFTSYSRQFFGGSSARRRLASGNSSKRMVSPKRVVPVDRDDSKMLKEFVMLNLKLDDARQRRHNKHALATANRNANGSSSTNGNINHREPIFSRIDQVQPRGVIKKTGATHQAINYVTPSDDAPGDQLSKRAVKKLSCYDTRTVSSASSANITMLDDTNDDQVSNASEKRLDRENKKIIFIDLERSLEKMDTMSGSNDPVHKQPRLSKKYKKGPVDSRRNRRSHKGGKTIIDKSGPSTSRM